MNKKAVAKELVKIAKSLTAGASVSGKMKNAEIMIRDGGRGTELGIRAIESASRDLAQLAKTLRTIQASAELGYSGQSVMQEDMLGILESYK